MTALLELKQKIKNLYSQYEVYILPVLRFILALVYFEWINANMGYMTQLCWICIDDRAQLCSGNRSCRIYAGADSVYDDLIPEIQCR